MSKVTPATELVDKSDIAIDVKKTLRPLTISLQIWSLYIPRDRTGVSRLIQWMYSVVIVNLLWANLIRVGVIFKSAQGLSESLATTSSVFLMYLCIAYMCTTILIIASQKLDPLLDTMIGYHRKHGFAYNRARLSKVITLFCLWAPISSVLSTAAMFYIWSIPGSEMARYLYPFENLSGARLLSGKIVLGVVFTYSGCIGYITIITFGTFCYCLSKEFEEFNNRVNQCLNNGGTDYEDIRLHHSDICKFLQETNGIVTHILFPILAVTLPITCLLLYGVIAGSLPIHDILMLLCFVLFLVSTSFAIIIAAALLNIKAHGSLEDWMLMRMDDLPTTTLQTISIFITRLTGPAIGFHVYGLFTIDTSTILTIVGALLTYAVVVLQFQPNETQHPTHAASTANHTIIQ